MLYAHNKTCTMNKPSLTFIVAIKSYHIRTCPEDFRKQKYYFDSQYFMLLCLIKMFLTYFQTIFWVIIIDLKVNKKYASKYNPSILQLKYLISCVPVLLVLPQPDR